MIPAVERLSQMFVDAMNERDDARDRIAAVRALCTARVPHPDRGAVPGQVYEATLRVRLVDTDVVLAALDGDAAGMLTDPDAEDPRIAAARGLVQEWTDQSDDALERAAALETTEYANIRRHVALRREAWTASHCAAELRRVLDGDPDTTGDDE